MVRFIMLAGSATQRLATAFTPAASRTKMRNVQNTVPTQWLCRPSFAVRHTTTRTSALGAEAIIGTPETSFDDGKSPFEIT
eukprot:CAMPEP_0185735098 /NCGR_PEP_ID=MMETSP1171-20130828/24301_1 /TAXON_ID=374046 /ORGANISM="Helicotheca tamensis, Strain CCMP826" /LENGTH=80 /DNA_ID=CAMNT_0028405283 /DNA_START=145 /DNA_END=383 /DNA_ORIENTATION=+